MFNQIQRLLVNWNSVSPSLGKLYILYKTCLLTNLKIIHYLTEITTEILLIPTFIIKAMCPRKNTKPVDQIKYVDLTKGHCINVVYYFIIFIV